MTDKTIQLDISTLKLPGHFTLRRDPPPRVEVLTEAFWEVYDTDTLAYDCIQAPSRDLLLFCPKVLNFRALFDRARFFANGEELVRRRWKLSRLHDVLTLRCSRPVTNLTIEIDGHLEVLSVNAVDLQSFQGLDTMVTKSRNNDLKWIQDWMKFHNRVHRINGLVFIDNGSDAYGLDELAAAMDEVPGYKKRVLIRTPLRFGPLDSHCTKSSLATFIQVAILNIVRARFFLSARTMLNVDVDELVVGPEGVSIADATAKSLWGFKTFHGRWRYARRTQGRVNHADHYNADPFDAACPTKYCLRPGSFVGRRELRVHSVAHLDRKLFLDRRFSFLHCRQISTSWKYDRSAADSDHLVEVPVDRALLDRVLG
jgi:hypothetical protein